MKKKLMALILCMVMALGLTACRMPSDGKRDADNSDVTQSQTQSYETKDITVAALKGPTAIGMVKLMEDSKEKKTANNYDFKIAASADEFSSLLIKGDVQIAALPCNAAATLYNKSNGKIKVLGINTLGVLYIVEKGNTVQNVADLKGKTIYTTGKGTTPEYTLKYLMKKAGLDAEKDVNIEFKSEASEAAAMLASSDSGAVAMLPQPYVTTVMAANSDVRIALDVTKEWENLSTDGSTVVTGVIAVNADYYEKNKAAVAKFMEEYENSVDFVNSNVDTAAEYVEEFGIFKAAVAKKAIPYCNITFIKSNEMKTRINQYLTILYESNPSSVGGSMPGDNFYAE